MSDRTDTPTLSVLTNPLIGVSHTLINTNHVHTHMHMHTEATIKHSVSKKTKKKHFFFKNFSYNVVYIFFDINSTIDAALGFVLIILAMEQQSPKF